MVRSLADRTFQPSLALRQRAELEELPHAVRDPRRRARAREPARCFALRRAGWLIRPMFVLTFCLT